jgi:molecular chaperone HscB
MNYYEALGLQTKLTLDADDLKSRFYERSRQWHPDRFSRASGEEQQKALDKTALLNDAFRTLRDPVARAEYVLEQKQIHPSKAPPPELLEEVFELNMALEELRQGDQSVRPQLEETKQKFLHMLAEIDHGIAVMSGLYDRGRDQSLLHAIRSVLDRRRYISNLLRDVVTQTG